MAYFLEVLNFQKVELRLESTYKMQRFQESLEKIMKGKV